MLSAQFYHDAAVMASIASSATRIHQFLMSADCIHTVKCMRQLGVDIRIDGPDLMVFGVGMFGLKQPRNVLDVGNAGTTIRLLSGLLCAQSFETVIGGDASIAKRPMDRIIKPLRQMGASIDRIDGKGTHHRPLSIRPSCLLTGINYTLPIASAQVKSAILLAGLYANGKTTVTQPQPCRDHTERILSRVGASVTIDGPAITVENAALLRFPNDRFLVPRDLSSAAFFIVLGLVTKGLSLTLSDISINETRTALITWLEHIGASVSVTPSTHPHIEPMGTISTTYSTIKNGPVPTHLVPGLIDEFPILSVLSWFGEGVFSVRGAHELRVKESDRIEGIARLVRCAGGVIEVYDDGFDIQRNQPFRDFEFDAEGDHRLAMSAIIGAIASGKQATVYSTSSITTSFPGFFELLQNTFKISCTCQ